MSPSRPRAWAAGRIFIEAASTAIWTPSSTTTVTKTNSPCSSSTTFPCQKSWPTRCRRMAVAAQPKAYRTVGAVQNTVLFVSVDGFLERVKNKDRAVSVWSLHTKDMEWYLITKVNLTALRQLIPWIRQRASGISPNVPPSQPHR
ncbi:hypothetical protein ZWY2020_019020 [Hordeum vulgare]|nr:hypothetical protein ZWY2020_019020 [Hordeum vulgare]